MKEQKSKYTLRKLFDFFDSAFLWNFEMWDAVFFLYRFRLGISQDLIYSP